MRKFASLVDIFIVQAEGIVTGLELGLLVNLELEL
jgi:hypothetical protein